jgi:hypothetical protein
MKTETDPVSETFPFRIPDEWQSPKTQQSQGKLKLATCLFAGLLNLFLQP